MKTKDSSLVFIHETDDHILLGSKTGELKLIDKHKKPVTMGVYQNTIKVEKPVVKQTEQGGRYTQLETDVVVLDDISFMNGDRIKVGFSKVTGQWYAATRKPVEVVREDDLIRDSFVFKFKDKYGWITHVRYVSTRDIQNKGTPCPACLLHRQEIQHVQNNHLCPRCLGLVQACAECICTCGEIPHRLNCPMNPALAK